MGILSTFAVTSSYNTSDLERALDGLVSSSSSAQTAMVWTIVSAVLAVVGGILVYFLFVKKKVNPANKFLVWLKGFLKFDRIVLDDILKITYLIAALFITLSSFSLIGVDFLSFLLTLVLGNVGLRVVYEMTMIMIMIWTNVTKIKDKLTGEGESCKVKEAAKKANKE